MVVAFGEIEEVVLEGFEDFVEVLAAEDCPIEWGFKDLFAKDLSPGFVVGVECADGQDFKY